MLAAKTVLIFYNLFDAQAGTFLYCLILGWGLLDPLEELSCTSESIGIGRWLLCIDCNLQKWLSVWWRPGF